MKSFEIIHLSPSSLLSLFTSLTSLTLLTYSSNIETLTRTDPFFLRPEFSMSDTIVISWM
ncbi:MAG: hypothetical protein PVH61_36290 [Candidatus Aminicenantes bacterium]